MTDSDRYLMEFNHRLDCARLLHAPPESVFNAFRAAADKSWSFCDPDVELALLSRNDPQINLGLAAYGENVTVVAALYRASTLRSEPTLEERLRDGSIKAALLALNDPDINSRLAVADAGQLAWIYKHSPLYLKDTSVDAQYRRELRHACLSNRRACRLDWGVGLLGSLISGKGEDLVASLLAEGEHHDLATLLANPTVGDDVLANLFKCTGRFERLDNEWWRRLVRWASENPRLAKPDRDSPDGPDLAAWNIRDGIEHLLNVEPPSNDSERDDWAFAVMGVLETAHPSLRPYSVNTQQIFAKWPSARPRKDTDDGKAYGRSLSSSSDSHIEQRKLCYLIAAMFGVGSAEREGTDSAPDEWMAQLRRCAHYGKDHLSVEDLDNGHAKDGDAFMVAVLCNDRVLINNELRGHLASVCYLRRTDDEPRSELNLRWSILDARGRYEYRCQQLQRDHPWVQADTPDPAETDLESPSLPQRSMPTSPDELSKSLARSLEPFKRWVAIGFVIVILVLLFRR